MTATERHEILAWLGDNPGLTDNQIADLMSIADDLAERYEDDREGRDAALTVAYRLMVEPVEDVVAELASELTAARVAEANAGAALQVAAKICIHDNARGIHSEAGFARAAGVDRMTVRNWIGK
jgi:hypothetical protein